MGRTAGAGVNVAYLHKANTLGNIKLRTIINIRKLVRSWKDCLNRPVCKNRLICEFLYPIQLFTVKDTAYVKDNLVITKVEANVIKAEQTVNDSAENMLGGVALHLNKTIVKIYDTSFFTNRRRSIGYVMYNPVMLVYMDNVSIANFTGIGTLSALLGEKGSLIKDNVISSIAGGYQDHIGSKRAYIGILIIKLLCHMV